MRGRNAGILTWGVVGWLFLQTVAWAASGSSMGGAPGGFSATTDPTGNCPAGVDASGNCLTGDGTGPGNGNSATDGSSSYLNDPTATGDQGSNGTSSTSANGGSANQNSLGNGPDYGPMTSPFGASTEIYSGFGNNSNNGSANGALGAGGVLLNGAEGNNPVGGNCPPQLRDASGNCLSGVNKFNGKNGQLPFPPGGANSLQAHHFPPTEFQNFIRQTTGRLLPRYGESFFQSNSVNPSTAMPVDKDYPIGPGDEVLIRGWGSIDLNVRAVVDRNGLVTIPRVGSVPLAGVKAGDAEGVLHNAIGRVFRDFNLSVTLGQLRGINIYVVGQAVRPGTYKVASTSTLVTALFESGGPNPYGSMRHVQVKRDGQVVAEIDLYSFFARGDKSADVHLIDGDVVVIPPALGYVALMGQVKTPAVYELSRAGEPLSEILEVAGGMPLLADPRKAYLEHVDASQEKPRRVEDFALDGAGLAHPLEAGDLVNIRPVVASFANAVTLRGYKRVPFEPGMRISDLIPSRHYLVAEQIARTRNAAVTSDKVNAIGEFYPDMDWDYAVVERLDPVTLKSSLVPFNLGQALDDPKSAANVELKPGDTVSVFNAKEVKIPISRRHVFVRIEGEVQHPGVYQVDQGEHLIDLIDKAGGATHNAYLFGSQFYRVSVQRSQQENYEKFIKKLEQQVTAAAGKTAAAASTSTDPNSAQARSAAALMAQQAFLGRMKALKPTGRMSLGLPVEGATLAQFPDIRMEDGDRLVIPARPDFVQVFGSVNTESALIWHPHRTVSDYLDKAGVSREAEPDDVFVMRPDGTILANKDSWFSMNISHDDVVPGDIIVVPEKLDPLSGVAAFINGAKDWTTIVFNFALGAAALKAMGF